MGERLNLEIRYGKKVLANAYYHWSGFTSSSLKLTEQVINEIINNNIDFYYYHTRVLNAIKLLENTGAGVTDEELQKAKHIEKYEFALSTGRNEGLLSVSKDGIANTQLCAEHTSVIDVSDMTVDVSDLFYNYTIEEYEEYEEEHNDELCDLDIIKFASIKDLNFDEFKSFTKTINNIKDNGQYACILKDSHGKRVLEFIE